MGARILALGCKLGCNLLTEPKTPMSVGKETLLYLDFQISLEAQ